MCLVDVQSEWFLKHIEMQKFRDAEGHLAAPFLSVREPYLMSSGRKTILLVGKATAGDWKLESFSATALRPSMERVTERHKASLDHLLAERAKQGSAFWRFWGDLALIGQPVIWTNLAKIGIRSGNPTGRFLNAQSELACRTLDSEIEEYEPSLIVLVSADYAKNEIIYKKWPQQRWSVSRFDGTCWIARNRHEPPVLWTDHPQGKSKERKDYWLNKARELIEN